MTKEQQNVRDFMLKAEQQVPLRPVIPSLEVRILRAKLIMEEASELIIKGLGLHFDFLFDNNELDWSFWEHKKGPNIVEIADGCGDLSVVNDGTALACGLDMEPIRAEIDRSNMSKFIDGHRREDGKWIKGPSYSPANLEPIIEAQSTGAQPTQPTQPTEPTPNVQYPG